MYPETFETLTRLSFAATFSRPVLETLAKLAVHRHANAGEVLFREGSLNKQFLLIVRGHVALEMAAPAKEGTRILTLGAGDMLAWSALLGGERMTATARCLEPTELVAIDGDKLNQLCEADHETGYAVMKRLAVALSRRLLATRLQLLDLYEPLGARV